MVLRVIQANKVRVIILGKCNSQSKVKGFWNHGLCLWIYSKCYSTKNFKGQIRKQQTGTLEKYGVARLWMDGL